MANKKTKKEVVKEEKTEEELKEEFFDEKEDKESLFKKIYNIVMWIILIVWMAICLVDFFRTQNQKTPVFTFKSETVKYDDGEVKSYLGAGYKIYRYNRKCYNGIQYGPFWLKDQSVESETCNK